MIAQDTQTRTSSIGWSQETRISRDLSLNVRRGFGSTQVLTIPNVRQLCGSLKIMGLANPMGTLGHSGQG